MTTTLDLAFFRRYADSYTYGFYLKQAGASTKDLFKTQSEDWVTLNINPQEISITEPTATVVTPMQGGGLFVESRGNVLSNFRISGTTGFLPRVSKAAPRRELNDSSKPLVDESPEAEDDRAERSGFAAFHKLRFLFQKFGKLRKKGSFVEMHFYNVKDDFFWVIEPQTFQFSKRAGKGMLYEYTIACQVIGESDSKEVDSRHDTFAAGKPGRGGGLARTISLGMTATQSVPLEFTISNEEISRAHVSAQDLLLSADAVSVTSLTNIPAKQSLGLGSALKRFEELVNNGLEFSKLIAGNVRTKVQSVIKEMSSLIQLLNNIADTAAFHLDTVLAILSQISSFVASAFDTMYRFSPANIQEELNEFLCEIRTQTAFIAAFFTDTYGGGTSTDLARLDQAFKQTRGNTGSTLNQMQDTGKPLRANPFLGRTGLDLVTDTAALYESKATRDVTINKGETIYAFAQRTLGTVHRFVDVVALNNLRAPYIVADATNRPKGTKAFGESLRVPVVSPDAGNTRNVRSSSSADSSANTVSEVGTSTELRDFLKAAEWVPNQWIGFTLTMTSGAASGETRVVTANDENVLTLNRAWVVVPSVGDSYTITLEQFDAGKPPDPTVQAYGRDVLVTFRRQQGSSYFASTLCDVVLNTRKDLAMVSGKDNLFQSLTLRLVTPKNGHQFHPDFGVPLPVGRPMTQDIAVMYSFFAKQSLLKDRRISRVSRPRIQFEGGALYFEVTVTPITSRVSESFKERL